MKTKRLNLRISEQDSKTIHSKASQAGLSLTEYVTRASLGSQIVIITGISDLITQQKAIGRNLNQLVTLANMGRVSVVSLIQTTAELAAIHHTLQQILQRKRW